MTIVSNTPLADYDVRTFNVDSGTTAGPLVQAMTNYNSMCPVPFDEISLSYTGSDLTGVEYKRSSITVATLTLSYTSGQLTGVVRT